jgi:hypothetical protein
MNVKQIRDRVAHSLSPQTAAVAGISLAELQQFIAGTVSLSPQQLVNLSRYLGIEVVR